MFRELGKGRLFLLPPVRDFRESLFSLPKLIDHCYWLCPECSLIFTLELQGTEMVVRKREPASRRSTQGNLHEPYGSSVADSKVRSG